MKTKINFKDSWNALLANAPLILIILYTLMPYKPWNLPISPSTVFIIVFFLFQFSELFRLWKFSVPKIEKILLAATVLTFTLSAFIKIDAFSAQGFIAYYSSFVTFLIIRLTYNPQRHAGILLKYFDAKNLNWWQSIYLVQNIYCYITI